MNRTTQPPADNPALWPTALHDELPTLRQRLVPLRDVVSANRGHSGDCGGMTLSSWRMRRTNGVAAGDETTAE